MLLPLVMNVIMTIYPPEKRGGAMGMLGLVVMFGRMYQAVRLGESINYKESVGNNHERFF